MRQAQGFALVYDVTSRKTFEEIGIFREQILRANDADKVYVLL